MGVHFCVGSQVYEIGSAGFLHSFFSTVAYHLENGRWGSRFPALMKELYQGALPVEQADTAAQELEEIAAELKRYPPDQVIWDIDDLSKEPPWGKEISDEITDLSNYFFTSDGEDFLEVLQDVLREAKESRAPVEIK